MVPHCVGDFSPLKNLARGDVIFKLGKVVVLIKWSKTMQKNNQVKLISVPRLQKSPICPVRALSNALALTPKGSNLPLFQVKSDSDWAPLIDTKARTHFNLILSGGNLSCPTSGARAPSCKTLTYNNFAHGSRSVALLHRYLCFLHE